MYSLLLLSFSALAFSYANPGACSGECTVHDPGLIKRASDGTYFRFSTGDRISYARASSIQGPWSVEGSVLPGGSSINLPGNQDLWAPDVSFVDGLYYVFYAVSTFGSQDSAIGLATSPTMEPNTWTDHGSVGVVSSSGKPYNAIDPNLLQDNGKFYLTFGSFWHDIYQVSMNNPPSSPSGSSYNLVYQPSGTHAVEGAFLYKQNGYYYLFYSAGQCCGYNTSRPPPGQEYMIKVCRSTRPNGGFSDKDGVSCTAGGGTIVLQSHGYVYGPGGQGIFDDPALGPVLYYHYINTYIGYADSQAQFGWNQIDFSSGWPVV